ncbi:hypothetical protein [Micromonospora endophytica]|uniref:Uncharacterized protein n=1 Tax=Micromonospora endophytica TaxID=515350 RepID=A0A2W2D794_9ACTN|nr:hypothetical protein [Micromonospora endophytica]PZF93016.1 hypothetical protein C1I93_18585 [Micromonospora endophytica]RIW50360.1 hypothetical protein D3H59_02730 [Micromonospora endophytica]BCJ57841.1 hypothetical protein Jiend_12630 [Micromonospora endophytica]
MANPYAGSRPRTNAARICTILGFVFAVVALFLSPLLFGLLAVGLGVAGAVQGDKPLGWYAAGAGVAAILLNLVLAAALT